MPPIAILLGARLVDQISQAHWRSVRLVNVAPSIAGLCLVTIIQRSVGAYLSYGRSLFARHVQMEAERRLLKKATVVDISRFDSPEWHDRLSRAKRDIAWRPGELTWAVLGLSGNLVTLVLMASVLGSLDRILVLLAVGASALSLTLDKQVTRRVYQALHRETTSEREREYLGDLVVSPRVTKEIRAHMLAHDLLGRHARLSDSVLREREQLYRTTTIVSLLTGLVTGSALAAAYLFVAVGAIARTINPGGIVLVIGAFAAVSGTLGLITNTLSAIDEHASFLDDYFSFLADEPSVRNPTRPRSLPAHLSDGIDIRDITFTYPGRASPVLCGLNLRIHAGELIAFVGGNGAGKSTLIKLLLRFYDVDSGSIRLGGIDIRDLDCSVLRERIGVLFQDYACYELSVRDCVAMGRPDRHGTDTAIRAALHTAQADSLVDSMMHGLDARVGRLFEGGHDLSGGEWQRLALARLIYRNADVWILDEPTAALDPEAESAIVADLKANLAGKIGIVISHRLPTVRIADRIAVIENGQVAALGTHRDLLRSSARYAHLFELQAAVYR